MPRILDIDTPSGLARAHLDLPDGAPGLLVLSHGAGGGVDAVDLRATRDAAMGQGLGVALVEQPYRVAGRRAPPRAPVLDAAWLTVVSRLREEPGGGIPLIAGGRSMGARVACRTAEATNAVAVVCLAFPLLPPARGAKEPESRLPELEAVKVPVLVVQGERDRFGMPPPGDRRRVVSVAGDHGLKADPEAVGESVGAWLREVAAPAAYGGPAQPAA